MLSFLQDEPLFQVFFIEDKEKYVMFLCPKLPDCWQHAAKFFRERGVSIGEREREVYEQLNSMLPDIGWTGGYTLEEINLYFKALKCGKWWDGHWTKDVEIDTALVKNADFKEFNAVLRSRLRRKDAANKYGYLAKFLVR